MIYWLLLIIFFRIGLFTVGGGYAMLPLIQQEIETYGWITAAEFIDIIAIAEMTPGAIAVNTATFVGFRTGGVLGSLVATTAIALPSLLIIVSLSYYWERHRNHPVVTSTFAGIRPAVAGLIGAAAVFIGRSALLVPVSPLQTEIALDFRSVLIAVLVFVAVRCYKVDPIYTIVASSLVGLAIFSF